MRHINFYMLGQPRCWMSSLARHKSNKLSPLRQVNIIIGTCLTNIAVHFLKIISRKKY
jgi:hypothetical protein